MWWFWCFVIAFLVVAISDIFFRKWLRWLKAKGQSLGTRWIDSQKLGRVAHGLWLILWGNLYGAIQVVIGLVESASDMLRRIFRRIFRRTKTDEGAIPPKPAPSTGDTK